MEHLVVFFEQSVNIISDVQIIKDIPRWEEEGVKAPMQLPIVKGCVSDDLEVRRVVGCHVGLYKYVVILRLSLNIDLSPQSCENRQH